MNRFRSRVIAAMLLLSFFGGMSLRPGLTRAQAEGGVSQTDLSWELRTESLAQELATLLKDPAAGEAQAAEKIDEIAQKILEDYTQQLRLDAQAKRQLWQRFKANLNARGLAQFIQSKKEGFIRVARTQGIPALATLVIEVLVNVAGSWVATALGVPQLIPVILSTPAFPVVHPVNLALYRKWQDAQFAKKFGGKENYQAYLDLRRGVRRELQLRTESEVFATLLEGNGEAVSVRLQAPSASRRLGYLFGMFSDDLTTASVLHFLKEEGVKTPFVDRLARVKSLDEPTKLYLLLNHLQLTLEDDLWIGLKWRFHTAFVDAKPTAVTPALRAWLQEAARVSEPSELGRLLKMAPSELSPPAKWTFWYELILPRAIENIALKMEGDELKQLRAASQETWVLSQKHLVDSSAKKYTDAELRSEFLSRLKGRQYQGVCAELFREMAI
jgi:hypothetical protein